MTKKAQIRLYTNLTRHIYASGVILKDFKFILMRKPILFVLIVMSQSCTPIYQIRNTTGDEKLVTIGLKVHKESDIQYSKEVLEEIKNAKIKNKNLINRKNSALLFYEIVIPSNKRIKLSELIYSQVLTSKYNHDSMDIRLASGQPIFVDSDSIKINEFRLIVLPWFRRLYYYVIE